MPSDGSRREVSRLELLENLPLGGEGIPDPPEVEEDPMRLEEIDLQEDLEVPDPPDLDDIA